MRRANFQTEFWQRRPAHRSAEPSERKLHIAVADLLRTSCKPGWWWSHIGHGEYRTKETGALLQRMGLKPGMADFLLISPVGVHCWLELKSGTHAELSGAQVLFCNEMRRRGTPYEVARDYNAAEKQLKRWGVL